MCLIIRSKFLKDFPHIEKDIPYHWIFFRSTWFFHLWILHPFRICNSRSLVLHLPDVRCFHCHFHPEQRSQNSWRSWSTVTDCINRRDLKIKILKIKLQRSLSTKAGSRQKKTIWWEIFDVFMDRDIVYGIYNTPSWR